MITTWVKRVFRPVGKRRAAEQDELLHDLRAQAQTAELERHLFQRQRERADLAELLAESRRRGRI